MHSLTLLQTYIHSESKLSDMLLIVAVTLLLSSFQVTSSTPAQYFSKKRGLANGVVFAGGGLGGAVLSLVLDPLIRKAGPAWAFRVLGLGTLATGLPAAWFLKERTTVRRGGFVEWYASLQVLQIWSYIRVLTGLKASIQKPQLCLHFLRRRYWDFPPPCTSVFHPPLC